ncbi:hypothetical protein BD413DRAFT_649374 [Trametes elegans]|nr:hypothetical protein BD413DRAFT_649374 [Trametes elegans]
MKSAGQSPSGRTRCCACRTRLRQTRAVAAPLGSAWRVDGRAFRAGGSRRGAVGMGARSGWMGGADGSERRFCGEREEARREGRGRAEETACVVGGKETCSRSGRTRRRVLGGGSRRGGQYIYTELELGQKKTEEGWDWMGEDRAACCEGGRAPRIVNWDGQGLGRGRRTPWRLTRTGAALSAPARIPRQRTLPAKRHAAGRGESALERRAQGPPVHSPSLASAVQGARAPSPQTPNIRSSNAVRLPYPALGCPRLATSGVVPISGGPLTLT